MIAVTATSFIKNKTLCEALVQAFPAEEIKFIEASETFSPPELVPLLAGARGWLVGKEPCTKYEVSHLIPTLKVVSKYGVGLDNVDVEFCKREHVKVYYEPGVNREAVAEHALGMIIGLLRNIESNSQLLHSGIWNKNGGVSLFGRRVGIVGFGNTGQSLAGLLAPFRCHIGYVDIINKSAEAVAYAAKEFTFGDLLAWAEVISFHVPLTRETHHMLNRDTMKLVQPDVYIVNTSRGHVIEQASLIDALNAGAIAGAALDVFENEPLRDKQLYQLKNLIATPHTAGNSREAVEAMGAAAIRGLKLHLDTK